MNFNGPGVMSFGDTFRAIKCGDLGVIVGFALECLIMASPIIAGLYIWLS